MVLISQLISKYGNPSIAQKSWEQKNMSVYLIPEPLRNVNINLPRAIYCHKSFQNVIAIWWYALKDAKLLNEIHWDVKNGDGCFAPRMSRNKPNEFSLHYFGMAIDLNSKDNLNGKTRDQNKELGLKPFTQEFIDLSANYVDCGYNFTHPDGMHFQIRTL